MVFSVVRKSLLLSVTLLFSGIFQLAPALADSSPPNLIPNSSVETASPTNSQVPQGWSTGRWGTNNTVFSYQNSGHTGGHSLKVDMSSYSSGDAKWYFSPVAISSSGTYTYSDYYMSTVKTEVLAVFYDAGNNLSYQYLSTLPANPQAWQQYTRSFDVPSGVTKMTIYHVLYSAGSLQTDDYSLVKEGVTQSVPQVGITAPGTGQTLNGTVNIAADASDSNGISNVQFKLGGQNLGPVISTTPYNYSWNTTSVADGDHSLTAVATNTLGQSAVSDPVKITVNNQSSGTTNTNLLMNGDFETADPASPSRPFNWRSGRWGANTYSQTYLATGHNSGHSVRTEITQYSSGAAYWYNLDQPVTAGKTYSFSNYYQSNTASEIDLGINMSDGTTKYLYLGSAAASPAAWTKFQKQFTTPAGAVSIKIFHEIFSVGWLNTDDYNLTENSQAQTQVVITAPSAGQTLSGTAGLAANASSTSGISSVQFRVDGQNLGAPISSSPYTYNWDTNSTSNGSHTLTAVATDSGGQTTESAPVSVSVNNQSSSSNLITNPSLENPNPNDPSKPSGWISGRWGSNTATLTYLSGNAHSGTRSVKAEITQYTSGAAHWIGNTIPVTPGQLYDYNEYYMSDTTTEIDAVFKMSDGSTKYVWLGSPFNSPGSWTKFRKQFSAPSGAVSVYMLHELYSAGWVITDDYSLSTFAYQGFKNPIISITDDDGYSSFNKYGLPLLDQYGFKSTDYIITDDPTRGSDYVNNSKIQELYDSGQEIGSHTITHPDLTTLSASQLDNELGASQTYLQNLLGVPVPNLAAPYGSYNQQVLDNAKKYYRSFRTVDSGYNARNNFDPYHIMVQNMHSDTTLAQFQSWVDQAKATNTWLVLVYHQVNPDTSSGTYNTYPADFSAQLNAIKNSGIPVETVNQALDEITAQL